MLDMDIQELKKRLDKVKKEIEMIERLTTETVAVFPEERMQLVRDGKCVKCGKPLGEEKPDRGCHSRCYRILSRSVAAGETTYDKLISIGMILPVNKSGRKKQNDVTLQMQEIKRQLEEKRAPSKKKPS